jgi:two-component system sensor histidine kinase KdpD
MKLRRINPYFGSFLLTAIFVAGAFELPERTSRWSASSILLMAVLASASIWGLRQGLIISFGVALCYDYLFIPPVYSLDIEDWQNALSLVILGLSAAVVSMLAELLNRGALAARRNEILTKRLQSLSQHMREAADAEAIAKAVTAGIGVAAGAKAMLALPGEGILKVVSAHPKGATLTDAEFKAARHACEHDLRRIGDAPARAGLTCTLLPMGADSGNGGILIVCETNRRFWQLPNRMHIVDVLTGAASSAFKRVALQGLAEEARIAAETEKLRSALLASISHDLKTPLAVVLGSASSLRELHGSLGEQAAQELLQSILEEGERLNQFIANLMDMSRVESEAVRPSCQLADLSDVIGSALLRARRALSRHRTVLQVPADIPPLEFDPVLMEKALFNILENAANYTPAGTQVTLTVSQHESSVLLQIWDEGEGIAPQELPHLFQKFYRGGTGAWKPTGTGLGLAIARGFLQAMGGTVSASNRTDRSGAVFTIRLPVKPAKVQAKVKLALKAS